MPAITTLMRWEDVPLGDLIDHIVTTYHRPLPAELARLQRLARRAARGPVDDRLAELRDLLGEHTQREEALVFPWLRGGNQRSAGALVNLLEHEHDDTLRRVRELRGTIEDAPASRTVRALAAGLRALEIALHAHLALENRVLFPRALAAPAA